MHTLFSDEASGVIITVDPPRLTMAQLLDVINPDYAPRKMPTREDLPHTGLGSMAKSGDMLLLKWGTVGFTITENPLNPIKPRLPRA